MNIAIVTIILLLNSVFINIAHAQPILAFNDGLNAPLTEKEDTNINKVVILYNKLIQAFKTNIMTISYKIQTYLQEIDTF